MVKYVKRTKRIQGPLIYDTNKNIDKKIFWCHSHPFP